MKQFSDLLKNLYEKIELPQPQKSHILLEIAADINDLYNYYLQKGMNEAEAAKKAREKFELTDDIISDLSEIHRGAFRQWLDKTIGKTQTLCERILLVVLSLFICITVIFAISTTPFYTHASMFTYPLLLILIMVLILSCVKIYQLYIKKDHHVNHLNGGMYFFNILAVANFFVGLFGYFSAIYFSGINTVFLGPLFVITFVDTNKTLALVIQFMIQSSLLVMICMFIAFVTAILWFIITQKINKIEQAEAEILLAE